jgi:hypothetical protein
MRGKVLVVILCTALLAAGLFTACNKGAKKEESAAPAGTTSIDDLIKAGKSPIELGNLFRGMSPFPSFTVKVTNVSDAPVKLINGTVLFFDADDNFLPEATSEAGYSELSPIEPGGSVELQIMASDDRAVRGKWIIKEVIYEKSSPYKEYGALSYKWINPNFDAELAAAKEKK